MSLEVHNLTENVKKYSSLCTDLVERVERVIYIDFFLLSSAKISQCYKMRNKTSCTSLSAAFERLDGRNGSELEFFLFCYANALG